MNVDPCDVTLRCIAKRFFGTVRQTCLKPPVAPASKLAHDERAGNSVNRAGENQTTGHILRTTNSATRAAGLRRAVGYNPSGQHDHTVARLRFLKMMRAQDNQAPGFALIVNDIEDPELAGKV